MAPATRYARSRDGVSIAYQVVGEGPLDFVYVPQSFGAIEALWEHPTVIRFFDRLGALGRLIPIRVPTLVLHRTHDSAMSVEHSRYLARTIPGARLVELPGVDTLPFLGDSASVLGEIEEFLTGSRLAHDADRVLATVMFTDIVGSTETAATLGDRPWRELLGEHDRRVRACLARYHGREIKSLGDGFVAVFDGPARAVRAGRAITQEVGALGLQVRAGLHTGEIEAIQDDVGGLAVHIGARVMGEARPGEVLVSGTVKDLVVGSGLRFAERGVHALRGVPGEWALWAVAA
jgi:class 3 adenylate cyclase